MSEIYNTKDAIIELKLADDSANYYAANHYWATVERAEAAEARATELAAQLATAQSALEQLTRERNDMRAVLDYWLHHARFLAGDYHKDSEYNLAVESLKCYKLQEGIEP